MIKLGELMMILDLHRQGLSVSAIARQTGIDRKTVRKYIERGMEAPAYGPLRPRQTVIEAFSCPACPAECLNGIIDRKPQAPPASGG